MWGIDAESLDAKVHVSVSTTNPIVLVWIAHSDIKVVSNISDSSFYKLLYHAGAAFQKPLLHGYECPVGVECLQTQAHCTA